MKAILKASIWLALCAFTTLANAASLEVNTYNNIAYFADDQSTLVKRYSLVDEKFLTPITLTATPKAVHVDSSGIYVSYGTQIFKLNVDGTNATQFRVSSEIIYDIESTDTYLILAGESYMQTTNKANGTFVDSDGFFYSSPYISLSQDNSQIFTTSLGISPADIYTIPLSSAGILGTSAESPYHGDYQIGSNPVSFPTKKRVVDSSGNVYNSSDLIHIGNVGGAYKDIGFWEGVPIVLRDNALYSYSPGLQQTGVYNLPQGLTAEKIRIYGDNIFVFGQNNGNLTANKYKVALTSPATTSANIIPTDLVYTPDTLALDKNQDTLYILSKANFAIFRWSISKAAYLTSIPIDNAPINIAYSADHQRIYLNYGDGTISYIDVSGTDTTEHPFINEHSYPYTVTATGPFIAIKDTSGLAGSFKVFTKDGIKTDTREWISYTSEAEWDDIYKRIYYISTNFDFNWLQLDTNTGKLGEIQSYLRTTSTYLDLYGWVGPIRVSQNGKIIAFASGRVLERNSLKELADIEASGSLKDMAWLQGNLFTIKGVDSNTYTQLERWQANFTRDTSASYEAQGAPIGLVPLTNAGKLVLIYRRDGKPTFEIRSYAAKDFDKDGYLDPDDALPTDPNDWLDFDDDGVGNNADSDDDNDGVPDTQDAFPLNPKETLDTDKDGIGNNEDTDDDGDGVLDSADAFPLDPSETKDLDHDGIGDNTDTDIDGDSVANSIDNFPLNRLEWIDTDKDGLGNNADTDDDNDGVPDDQDRFPLNPLESKDLDFDGIGDNSDLDIDGDGALNVVDAFPLDNSESLDADKDGIGNNSDTDDDNDGVIDVLDRFPLNPLESKDMDNDGIGDNSDIDIDGDGILNINDAFPLDRNESVDSDKDGIGNNTDTDDDNDGVSDINDFYPNNATKSTITATDFYPIRKGSSWIYDFGDQAVVLGSDVKIAGKTFVPFTFPSGYKIYLNVSDNQIQLLGIYQPNIPTEDGNYTLDMTFNKGINLTSSNTASGSGNINISPKYGNKTLNWNSNTQYLGSENVVVPAGQYTALHTRVSVSMTANIDGETLPINYNADFWFAETVGIVKMIENGYVINLVSATIPAPQPSSIEAGSTSGGTSGGSGGGGSMGWLTLALLLMFCTPNLRAGARKIRKSH